MSVGISEIGRLIAPRWLKLAAGSGLIAALWLLDLRLQGRAVRHRRERRIEEELAAYARLDMRLPADGDALELRAE